jgi:hypothetical protein
MPADERRKRRLIARGDEACQQLPVRQGAFPCGIEDPMDIVQDGVWVYRHAAVLLLTM